MDCTASKLAYKETGYFTKIILDYLENKEALKPFYSHPVSLEGIASAIHDRDLFKTDRGLLVEGLKKQYASVPPSVKVNEQIEKLLKENTYTITTAHQPAIFTGTLYFIYKILHTIRLAENLSSHFPEKNFVPIFFMGSEDADLDELGKIFMMGEKKEWDTKQKGAVGRMNTKGLEKIITKIEGELLVQPFGKKLIEILKDAYQNSPDVQTATFKLIHSLFSEYGLVVFIPDNPLFKKAMIPVFEADLFHQTSSGIVENTIADLSKNYKVQAHPREINLFYLKDNLRGRIEKKGDRFFVLDSKFSFSEIEMKEELLKHPEHFSPNVILRGIMQETILPNLAFIGGGGELAYWLELKNLFAHFKVPYPVLILRNSFLFIEKRNHEKLQKLNIGKEAIFQPLEILMNELVKKNSGNQLSLQEEIKEAKIYYQKIKQVSTIVDPTLGKHVESLQSKAVTKLEVLEKKLLKAEKRKFEDQRNQLQSIKSSLFPLNNLQERIDNFMPYYAKWGKSFIDMLYNQSLTLESCFIILEEKS